MSVQDTIQEHGGFVLLGVLGVVLLAIFTRGSSGGRTLGPTPVDPALADVERARIEAGSSGLATLASLVGLEHQTDAQHDVALQEFAQNEDIARLQTEIELTRINAARDVDRFQAVQETKRINKQENTKRTNGVLGFLGDVAGGILSLF